MLELQIFIIALVASFIGIMIPGVSSALWVSSMILLGIPVQIAKTTYQFGNVWINLGALLPLLKTQKLRKDLIIPLAVIALISWFLWGKILVNIPTILLLKLTGAFMIGLLFVNVFSKSLGIISAEVSRKRKYVGFIFYFLLNLFFSIFPMGAGILYQFLHTFFFRVTNLEARLMGCFLTTPFIIGFIFPVVASGFYSLSHSIIFTIGWYIGWFFWAKSGIKLWNSVLKKILMIWLFFLGIYFLFFAKV